MTLSVKNMMLLVLMLVSASLAAALRPTISLANQRAPIDLKAMVPTAFDVWREETNVLSQVVNPQQQETLERIYSQTLSRTYVNSHGYRIMLSVAYGKNQSDALQLHKPEVCYPAQGFALTKINSDALTVDKRTLPVTRLVASLGQRIEPVTYWTTVGDQVVRGSIKKKLAEIRYSFAREIPDGLLFRVSSIDTSESRAFEYQDAFVKSILLATIPRDRDRLAGKAH